MFEIGSTLREERRRRGLQLEDVASETRIRAQFLDAIEREDWEALPVGVYRRSFLRGYADFLGLDSDAYAHEYEHRFAPAEPEPEPVRRSRSGRLPVLALAVAAVVAVLAVGGWLLTRSDAPKTAPPQATTSVAGAATTKRTPHRQAAPPKPARSGPLVLTAARGSCWISVKAGSASGTTVYEQTLQQGQTVRFGLGRTLYIRFGAPWNVDAKLAGRTVHLPSQTGDVVATQNGLR
ncbi:MAG: helix-turn-helix domain-containing protein [Gaiellaceae bacterium]